jgi:large subunit ribosomal protein L10
MPKTKEQKSKILESLKEKVAKQKAMVFVDFTGLKMKDMSSLRKKMKDYNTEFKASKKTLMNIAFKDSKLDIDTKKMSGELAMVLGYKDEISTAKVVWQFSQENDKVKILGGFINNEFVGADQIVTLATLPSREQLLAQLVGTVSAPVSGFVSVLNGNIRNLVYVLSQIKVAQ